MFVYELFSGKLCGVLVFGLKFGGVGEWIFVNFWLCWGGICFGFVDEETVFVYIGMLCRLWWDTFCPTM